MFCSIANGPTLLVALLGLIVSGADGPESPSSPDDPSYQAAAEVAGRDADSQLRLALWCEAQGFESEAKHHLALAVLIDPNHAAARALMGRVRLGDSWLRPGDVPSRAPTDPDRDALRDEYEGRRSRISPTKADDHWKLALWCEKNSLADEATAHFSAVTRLDPKREAAWKRLGYSRTNGRWMTASQIAAEKAQAEARAAIEAEWLPRIEQWTAQLADPATRGEALAGLSTVDDPLLVPAVWSMLVAGRRADPVTAVQVFGQIDTRDASRALAQLAAFSEDAEVRRLATETLKRRDAREWADGLIRMIRKPIQYNVRPVGGPGSPGELYVEGKQYNYRRMYAAPLPPMIPTMPGDQLVIGSDGLPALHRYSPYAFSNVVRIPDTFPQGFDPTLTQRQAFADRLKASGGDPQVVGKLSEAVLRATAPEMIDLVPELPDDRTRRQLRTSVAGHRTLEIPIGRALLEAQRAAAMVEEHLRRDVAAIEAHNAPIRQLNSWVLPVLEEATGARNGDEPDAWRAWWVNQIGMRQILPQLANGTSTFTDVISVQPRPVASQVFDQVLSVDQSIERTRLCSCFGKGTPVHTIEGIRPIEQVQMGDLVLSQDTTSGSLVYRPIVATHHNPPSKTFEVRMNGETIVSSEFHRFWLAGRGWVMARDLRVGDVIRALGQTAEVEAIDEGEVQPVYNLDVADSRSFFVGKLGALVHDNSLPTTTITPFDAVPDLAELARVAGSEPEGNPGD